MCGRLARAQTRFTRLERVLQTDFGEHAPRYNIAPAESIPVIHKTDSGYALENMQWSLIPEWSKTPITSYSTFNARIETVSEKPMYANALQHRRCLIPASGFYEWRTENERRQPYYFSLEDGEEMALAGIWGVWTSPNGAALHSCSILVGQANTLVDKVHGRMASIVPERHFKDWLNPHKNTDYLLAMLSVPFPAQKMQMHKVGRSMNSIKNQGAHLIEPLPLP